MLHRLDLNTDAVALLDNKVQTAMANMAKSKVAEVRTGDPIAAG